MESTVINKVSYQETGSNLEAKPRVTDGFDVEKGVVRVSFMFVQGPGYIVEGRHVCE